MNKINLKDGTSVVPLNYRAQLVAKKGTFQEPLSINYIDAGGKNQYTNPADVASTELSVIAYNIPVELQDPITGMHTLNPDFGKQVDALVQATGANRIIWFCRSGDRSGVGCYYRFCPQALGSPNIANYDIDIDVHNSTADSSLPPYLTFILGYGGFESRADKNQFLGYRGFPDRYTDGVFDYVSVSFKDQGMPMLTGKNGKAIPVPPYASR